MYGYRWGNNYQLINLNNFYYYYWYRQLTDIYKLKSYIIYWIQKDPVVRHANLLQIIAKNPPSIDTVPIKTPIQIFF